MDQSTGIFDDLNRTGPILHGIIKPDPENGGRISIASPDDLSEWTSLPVSDVRTVTKVGNLRGLPADHHLVNVAMKSDFSPDQATEDSLRRLSLSDLATAIVPLFCYDPDTGQQIPCPRE